ncbi:hypothetical protein HGRIS_008725 [Hohenbuehelia grisea]|uniref:SMC hinge domain-containing protein n=1 Tax=Hohenbuehelia grisea TaxID=104357 RepID=A0ABR3J8W2_9AGAR
MPPRRSSRSRASVEPTSVETLPSKRKRASQVIDLEESHSEEKENVSNPPARTTRRSSVQPSKPTKAAIAAPRARVASRTRTSLPEVIETDEEVDEAPPTKKARPSLDLEEDSEIEEIKPTRQTRGGAQRKGRNVKEAEADVKPVIRGVAQTSKAAAGRRTSSRAGSKAPQPRKSAPGDDISVPIPISDSDDDVQELPAKPKGRARKPPSRASVQPRSQRATRRSAPRPESDGEDAHMAASDEDRKPDIEDPPVASSRPPTPPAGEESEDAAQPAAASSTAPVEEINDGKEDEDIAAESAQAKSEASEAEPQEDEEKSLLEQAVKPAPLSQAPAAEEPQEPKSRLVIHKLALINFKSYAGRQEIGPFHKSFSAIVGPNGSGKSNTIDALLFVFGYRATKMRQAKLSELIHNSARYPDLDECSVEVYFREIIDLPGPDEYKVVPKSQLVVTRHAYKDNGSKYTINGKQRKYAEVQALLKGRGIDLDHKRFLILQGEVESIAQMKPKGTEHDDGLLEYLEDIIGTSHYKEPIDEALVEVERLQDERGEKLNRLRLVEKEKNALEDRKREAENYLRLYNEHVRAQSRLWQWYLYKCLISETRMEKEIADTKQQLQALRDQNKDDVTHFDMLTEHYQEREKAYEEIREAAAAALKDLAAHEKQEVGLNERRKHATSKAKKLKKSVQDDRAARTRAERLIADSAEKLEKEQEKMAAFEGDLAAEEKALEKILEGLRGKTQVFHDQIQVHQGELQPWTAKINAKQKEINVATGEKEALEKKANELKDSVRESQEALARFQEERATKTTSLESVKKQKLNLQQERRDSEALIEQLRGKVEELRRKASSSRNKTDEAKASQAANTTQSRVLEGLNRLKAQGRVNGFYGRLGSLGTIPDKYDVAISTACGQLNNMVVDTVEEGQKCIEHLRTQNLGRASFLVLSKLEVSRGMDPIKTPESVPRLYDLVKPKDPKFLPAFYKALRDTLVAENLEQANRIAYGSTKRWRVVTLQGGLIETSGAMSGGGNHVTRGLMSSKLAAVAVHPDVLRRYEHDSQNAERLYNEAHQELKEAEAQAEHLARADPETDLAIRKLELDISNLDTRITEAEKRVRELKSRSKPDAGELARISVLEDEIAASTEQLEELQTKTGKIEVAIKELEKKILEIGGSKLLAQKSKVEGLKLHINLASEAMTQAEVTKTKAEKDFEKYCTSITADEAALKDAEAEAEELENSLAELKAYVSEVKEKVEKAQAAAENSKDDLDTLKAELDAKNEEINAFRQKEMGLQQTLGEREKEHAENAEFMQKYHTLHDELRLEDVDDDDEDEDEESGAQEADLEGDVKEDPDAEPRVKAEKRARTPSHELHVYTEEELAQFKKRELTADTEVLEERLRNAKPDLSVLKEFKKREEEFFNRAKDLQAVTNARDAQKQTYDGLRKQRLEEFMAGFNLISLKLKEMYQMITLGGNAELELVDSMDPFSEGIIFSVMPPKKSWKNISNLSGGEKTLSSLALVFALHVFKPTPLYFMDEIDAALDFRNVSIVANYIKDRTKNAQFIIISLRNDMFELSHRLIGIYKTSNATQSISIDNHALSALPTRAQAINQF